MNRSALAVACLALALTAGTAGAQPASQPADDERAELGGRGGRYLERLVDQVAELDLTDAQRESLRRAADDLRADVRAIAERGGNRAERGAAVRERLGRFRRDVGELLDDDQRAELADTLQRMRQAGDVRDPNRPQMATGDGDAPQMKPTMPMNERPGEEAFEAESASSPVSASRFVDRIEKANGKAEALPTDLTVLGVTGNETTLRASLAEHRPTVVILGSWSAPSFRDRLADLPWLIKALSTPSGRSADLLIVYTRERHPVDAWQSPRNEAEGVAVAAHTSADDRVAAAVTVRNLLPKWPGLSLVLDDMDDELLSRIAGDVDEAGDWAAIVLPDGTITAKQRWFDPTAIPALVAEARSQRGQ